jgi:hypothetical protein
MKDPLVFDDKSLLFLFSEFEMDRLSLLSPDKSDDCPPNMLDPIEVLSL